MKLNKTMVRTDYGPEYRWSNTTNFPYMKRCAEMGKVRPIWPIHRLAIILTCDSCTMLNKKWVKKRKKDGDF